jgi:ribosomal protein S27AE
MSEERPAFGERLEDLVKLGAIEFRPEPLDAIVERRLKTIWAARSCPNCGEDSLHALEGSPRIWCGRCGLKTTYTRGTPFYDSELAPGEFLIAFILYADTLLSINQIAFLLSPCYKTLRDRIRELETAFLRGFPTVWERISQTVDGPTQVDETQQVCSGFKGQDPPREGLDRGGSPAGGRTRWTGEQGDELTLVAACRDVLRVVSADTDG